MLAHRAQVNTTAAIYAYTGILYTTLLVGRSIHLMHAVAVTAVMVVVLLLPVTHVSVQEQVRKLGKDVYMLY